MPPQLEDAVWIALGLVYVSGTAYDENVLCGPPWQGYSTSFGLKIEATLASNA
jgi:hypothetical protein